MDVVLLQLPFWGVGCPPLGPALLKSYLSKHNISCKVFDINAHAYFLRGKKYLDHWEMKNGYYFYHYSPEKMLEFYNDNKALFLYYIDEIRRLNPKIVGCSCHNTSIILSKIFFMELRKYFPHFKHILGGPEVAGFMRNADELLSNDYIDAVCLDEGEFVLLNYFRSLGKGSPEPIPGLIFKEGGRIIRSGPAVYIKDLDELPFPDFSDFDIEYYYKPNSLSSYTSRGCVNRCVFCSARAFMKPYRNRSGKRLFEEFKYLKEHYPEVGYLRLADNVSNGNIKELEILCDLLIEANLGIKWVMDNAVVRKEMRTPIYQKLKRAGCILINYGMETPSPGLLEKIGKNFSKDVDIRKVLKEGKKAGIYIGINAMFGLPGETEYDFRYLMEFAKKNRRLFNSFNPSLTFCEFYPGSLGFENPEKYGLDLSKGILFWESKDKTNTYLIRMRRFEEFCKLSKKYKFENIFNVEELPNKFALLFEYYFISNEYDKAMECYHKIPPEQITDKIMDMCRRINNLPGQDREAVMRENNSIDDKSTFEEAFINASLIGNIEQLEGVDIFKNAILSPWKKKIRSIVHRVIGYNRIIAKINTTYSLVKILDAKIRCIYKNSSK